MPKKSKKTGKNKKMQIKFKKPKIKFEKPSWENIKNSEVTKYSLIVLLVFLFFIAVDFGVQYLNNDYSAAVVNGSRITNNEYYYRLDQSYGSAIVSQLIEEELIRQQAEEEGVTITQEEIDTELTDIATQVGGEEQLNLSLEAYNLTVEDLERQIETDILTQKMLEDEIDYTEEDVMAFFEEYSEVIFPEEAAELEEGELLDYESHKDYTLELFLQQEIESARGPWLAELEEEARIQNNIIEDPSYRFLGATRNIFSNVWDEINSNDAEVEAEE
jgi:hypothetical protein